MFSNTGAVSFILYSLFIVLALIGMFIAIYFLRKENIPLERLDKIIELTKYTIVSIAIATVSLIVSSLFKEREQEIKEMEYFDKYVQDVKNIDKLQERYQLSKFLSIVAPSGDLKQSWKNYYDTLVFENQEIIRLKKEKSPLDTISNPTKEQQLKKEELNQKIDLKSDTYNNFKPRVYIQICDENQRPVAKLLQSVLLSESFLVPGIENIGRSGQISVPVKTEIRYYREEELPDALRLISLLKNQKIGVSINETPQKIPGNGGNTRPGHFEIWFSKK